jgi:hypothetical protein
MDALPRLSAAGVKALSQGRAPPTGKATDKADQAADARQVQDSGWPRSAGRSRTGRSGPGGPDWSVSPGRLARPPANVVPAGWSRQGARASVVPPGRSPAGPARVVRGWSRQDGPRLVPPGWSPAGPARVVRGWSRQGGPRLVPPGRSPAGPARTVPGWSRQGARASVVPPGRSPAGLARVPAPVWSRQDGVGDHVIPQGFDQVIPQVLAVFLF